MLTWAEPKQITPKYVRSSAPPQPHASRSPSDLNTALNIPEAAAAAPAAARPGSANDHHFRTDHLMADLKGLLARPARPAEPSAAQAAPEMLDARDPRALYRRLQAWGASLGRPRRESETPAAYQAVLSEAQPEQARAVGTVTAVYHQARYGAQPPAAQDVDRAVRETDSLRFPPG